MFSTTSTLFMGSLSFHRESWHGTPPPYRDVVEFFFFPAHRGTQIVLDDNTGSIQSLNRVSQWVDLAKGHEDAKHEHASFYPTRLLKLGSSVSETICLCVTKECAIEGEYATLSHCWGSGQPTKLETDNLEIMKSGITVSSLPRTFRDAIVVARHLNIEYLWIDSLCIIQNSSEDWQTEVQLMEAVYSNSCCNIAASHSINGDGGLFVNRDPYFTTALEVRAEWDNVEHQNIVLHPSDFWATRIGNAPLNKRGWVLQERVLAPRTIHFTHDQIIWEAQTERACKIYFDEFTRASPYEALWGTSGASILDLQKLESDLVTLYTCWF
ncbi:hypothetical protein LSUE1_G006736 [Lachnellula suecica]|uniref:Heterokaryon incompatibility domain-containing protein n=1 Tax=Lachnellula suecica TaxID=602035 RepID=A0A8T9C520_9HELO|nr:hypothetical protein LSUE1_G006736 [Lachnellula suecica]